MDTEQDSDPLAPGKSGLKPLRASVRAVEITYSGPLPPPGVLREFEQIVPGSAAKVFHNFEQQAAHRREAEIKIVNSNVFAQKLGALSAGNWSDRSLRWNLAGRTWTKCHRLDHVDYGAWKHHQHFLLSTPLTRH